MYELCTRAIKLFKKTRASASKSSIRGAREIDQLAVHEQFKDETYNPDTQKILEKIRNYKPKQSYLEFKNEAGEIQIGSSALKFINQAKKQTERFQKRKAMKKDNQIGEESEDEIDLPNNSNVESRNFNNSDDEDLELEDDINDDDDDEEAEKTSKSNLQKRFFFFNL